MNPNQETVLIDAIIGAVGIAIAPTLAKHGVDAEGTKQLLNYVGAGLTALVALAAALHARSTVTPLANPKTNDGTPLVPAATPASGAQTMKVAAPAPSTPAVEGHTEP